MPRPRKPTPVRAASSPRGKPKANVNKSNQKKEEKTSDSSSTVLKNKNNTSNPRRNNTRSNQKNKNDLVREQTYSKGTLLDMRFQAAAGLVADISVSSTSSSQQHHHHGVAALKVMDKQDLSRACSASGNRRGKKIQSVLAASSSAHHTAKSPFANGDLGKLKGSKRRGGGGLFVEGEDFGFTPMDDNVVMKGKKKETQGVDSEENVAQQEEDETDDIIDKIKEQVLNQNAEEEEDIIIEDITEETKSMKKSNAMKKKAEKETKTSNKKAKEEKGGKKAKAEKSITADKSTKMSKKKEKELMNAEDTNAVKQDNAETSDDGPLELPTAHEEPTEDANAEHELSPASRLKQHLLGSKPTEVGSPRSNRKTRNSIDGAEYKSKHGQRVSHDAILEKLLTPSNKMKKDKTVKTSGEEDYDSGLDRQVDLAFAAVVGEPRDENGRIHKVFSSEADSSANDDESKVARDEDEGNSKVDEGDAHERIHMIFSSEAQSSANDDESKVEPAVVEHQSAHNEGSNVVLSSEGGNDSEARVELDDTKYASILAENPGLEDALKAGMQDILPDADREGDKFIIKIITADVAEALHADASSEKEAATSVVSKDSEMKNVEPATLDLEEIERILTPEEEQDSNEADQNDAEAVMKLIELSSKNVSDDDMPADAEEENEKLLQAALEILAQSSSNSDENNDPNAASTANNYNVSSATSGFENSMDVDDGMGIVSDNATYQVSNDAPVPQESPSYKISSSSGEETKEARKLLEAEQERAASKKEQEEDRAQHFPESKGPKDGKPLKKPPSEKADETEESSVVSSSSVLSSYPSSWAVDESIEQYLAKKATGKKDGTTQEDEENTEDHDVSVEISAVISPKPEAAKAPMISEELEFPTSAAKDAIKKQGKGRKKSPPMKKSFKRQNVVEDLDSVLDEIDERQKSSPSIKKAVQGPKTVENLDSLLGDNTENTISDKIDTLAAPAPEIVVQTAKISKASVPESSELVLSSDEATQQKKPMKKSSTTSPKNKKEKAKNKKIHKEDTVPETDEPAAEEEDEKKDAPASEPQAAPGRIPSPEDETVSMVSSQTRRLHTMAAVAAEMPVGGRVKFRRELRRQNRELKAKIEQQEQAAIDKFYEDNPHIPRPVPKEETIRSRSPSPRKNKSSSKKRKNVKSPWRFREPSPNRSPSKVGTNVSNFDSEFDMFFLKNNDAVIGIYDYNLLIFYFLILSTCSIRMICLFVELYSQCIVKK